MIESTATDPLVDTETMARKLTEIGLDTSPATLVSKRSRGGGPPYIKFCNKVRYRLSAGLAWGAENTRTLRSTSEGKAT